MTALDDSCDHCSNGCASCDPLWTTVDLWPTRPAPTVDSVPDRVVTIDGTVWHYFMNYGWMEPLT